MSWHGFGTTHLCADGLRFSWKDGWSTFLTFEGASPWVRVEAEGEHAERYHFFRGQDPSCWRTGVRAFDKVIWRDLYPGIDVYARWSATGIEYDLAVSPGARLEDVVVRVDGVKEVKDLGEGGFVLETPAGVIRHGPPVSVLIEEGGRRGVCSSLRRIDERRWGFVLGGQVRAGRVFIDPVLEFATLLGGFTAVDRAQGTDYDSDGSVLVAGFTGSPDFPVTAGAYCSILQNVDSYVVRLLDDGTGIVFGTFIGGSSDDTPTGMAVHTDGSIYLVGAADSTDYPLTPGAVDTTFGGFMEGFVTRLAATGDALVFSTFLGGTNEGLRDIAVDSAGNTYVCGDATSSDYPTTTGAFDVAFGGPGDAVITAINATGTALLWSTFLGGTTGAEQAFGIDLDSAGSVYVCGWHGQGSGIPTSDFPVTPGAYQTMTAGGGQTEAFVTKFAPGGASLAYSTFLVGYAADRAHDLAVDFFGRASVVGETHSSDFPTTPGAFDPTFNSLIEGFVTKLAPDGSSLVWSTFLGGNGYDRVRAVHVDAAGSVVAASEVSSTNMVTTAGAPVPSWPPGYVAGHLAKISAQGAAVTFAAGARCGLSGHGRRAGPGGERLSATRRDPGGVDHERPFVGACLPAPRSGCGNDPGHGLVRAGDRPDRRSGRAAALVAPGGAVLPRDAAAASAHRRDPRAGGRSGQRRRRRRGREQRAAGRDRLLTGLQASVPRREGLHAETWTARSAAAVSLASGADCAASGASRARRTRSGPSSWKS
ncbi:MAG: SBBP repeat-containing protein [Planctomycetes bacterium]|nr:SBBP repeat-containing protein [Planctomycetota bacterium]